MSTKQQDQISDAVAIVGLSGRFPGAADVQRFWENLRGGVESITFFNDKELSDAGVSSLLLRDPGYVKAGAILDSVDMFPAAFFGFTPKEAEVTDPQHRIFIECAWEALEDAGYVADSYPGRIGVYAGAGLNTYMIRNLLPNRALLEAMGVLQLVIGNKADFMPTQVSYKLNLKGPSVNVNTACSTSLVAVHMACRSLLSYECDMALAGGVTVQVPQKEGYLYQFGGVASPDGHCRAFDAKAQGTVCGSGAGVVVLKRLDEALQDGDHVYAVVRGSAINNDGAQKIGYTAPSIEGQKEVIAMALAVAEVDPHTISYVEAHGTGTSLGDPIEVRALTQAFRMGTDRNGFCAIGSVKSNVGHLDAAAGVVSLIKTALCLEHKMLVPSISFEQSNPAVDFATTPFYVNTALSDWTNSNAAVPRRAGVSSFGIGGTNAHLVLEETPPPTIVPSARKWKLLLLSAQSESALDASTNNLARYLAQVPQCDIADAAYTLQVGRKAFGHRRMFLCNELADACNVLHKDDPRRSLTRYTESGDVRVGFMFPGIGEHYVNMAIGLYRHEPVFRRSIDRCAEILQPLLGLDLRELLYPQTPEMTLPRPDNVTDGTGATLDLRAIMNRTERAEDAYDKRLRQTIFAHPALFTIEYALVQLWREWGIVPSAMIGHSLGEYTAACVAGVMSIEDALAVVAKRARLIQELPTGRMLAVALPSETVKPMLAQNLSLAAINGPSQCVVAGPADSVAALERELNGKGFAYRPVQSEHAFHSKMMEPIREPLTALFRSIKLNSPTIAYLSNLTGTWITDAQATDPEYWARHTCQTVCFGDGIEKLCEDSDAVVLEVGPGQSLSSFALLHPGVQAREDITVLQSLPGMHDPLSDEFCVTRTLGSLWCLGKQVDWTKYQGSEKRRRVSLPTYPFERQRYWIDPPATDAANNASQVARSAAQNGAASLLYVPSWVSARVPAVPRVWSCLEERWPWLIFLDDAPIPSALLRRLEQSNQAVVAVRRGEQFARLADGSYVINPVSLDDYRALAMDLGETNTLPRKVVHCWALSQPGNVDVANEVTIGATYSSLVNFAQAFGALAGTEIQLAIVSNNVHAVTGLEAVCPEKATLLGPCTVIPLECPQIRCSNIDLIASDDDGNAAAVTAILHEFDAGLPNEVVACRGYLRWTRTYAPLVQTERPTPGLRPAGIYLITDYRADGASHVIATYLARQTQGTLVLIVESELPPRAHWQQYLSAQGASSAVQETLNGVRELEALGAKIIIVNDKLPQGAADELGLDTTQLPAFDGVVHFLQPFKYGLIQFKGEAHVSDVVREVGRAFGLMRVLDKVPAGFVAFVTSNLGFAGAAGRVDYCAANAFVQAFSDHLFLQKQTPTRMVTLDLRSDKIVNSSSDAFPPALLKYLDTGRQRYAVGKDVATDILDELFSGDRPRLAVSASDLNTAVQRMRHDTLSTIFEHLKGVQDKGSIASRGVRPPYIAPQSDMEKRIVELWENLFGIRPIGLNDGFFSLGGSSLLAVQFVSRLREVFQVEVPLRTLFQFSSVREIADVVEDILLSEIEALSDDEVKQYAWENDTVAVGHVEPSWYQLPNQLRIQHFNKVETDHFYKDIFEARVYYRNGIELKPKSIVFDVGANIGLFSIFVHQQCRDATIFAFEPAPPVFEALRSNTASNSANVRLFNCGVASRTQTRKFTFYPHSTGMSSFHADKEEEKQVLRAIMHNQLEEGMEGMQEVMEHVDDILEERFKDKTFDCELVTLSEVIRRHDVGHIDLLKIDVQKSELEVLQGIDSEHWPKIRQIVVEVHDINNRAQTVSQLLQDQGYRVIVEQESLYRGSSICNLYAIRS